VGGILRMAKFTEHRNRKANGERFYAWYPPLVSTMSPNSKIVTGQREASQTAALSHSPVCPTTFYTSSRNEGNEGYSPDEASAHFYPSKGNNGDSDGLTDQASQTAASGCPPTPKQLRDKVAVTGQNPPFDALLSQHHPPVDADEVEF
jgi:hypothetical protein